MVYRVEIAPAAARELRRLAPLPRARLEPAILALAEEPPPTGARKVRAEERAYRIRVGDYRIIYEVYSEDRLVVLLTVGRRHERTYRRL